MLVSIDRAGQTVVPRGGTVITPGDKIVMFADAQALPQALITLVGSAERPATTTLAGGDGA